MDAYVINLDRCPERWKRVEESFQPVSLRLIRVSAVDISQMEEIPQAYRRFGFWLRNGREATPGEIGCSLSHRKAMEQFLATDAPFALICEDDFCPDSRLGQILKEATASPTWEILRVYQARQTGLIPYITLPCGTRLCTAITCLNSTAAYAVSRKGAEILLSKTKTIRVPLDVRYWYGWVGLRESTLLPLGGTLSEFTHQSTISPGRRWLTPLVHPLWWAVRFFRVVVRTRRYAIQFFRAFRRY